MRGIRPRSALGEEGTMFRQTTIVRWTVGATLALLLAAALAACGGDSDSGSNGNGDGDGGGDGNVLQLVSRNTLFDKSELRATAGEITIEHDNQDGGILHNVHVYRGTDATGESVGMTELEAGPSQQTLTLTLEAGEYFYVCDAHPATMTGQLIVE